MGWEVVAEAMVVEEATHQFTIRVLLHVEAVPRMVAMLCPPPLDLAVVGRPVASVEALLLSV